MKINRLESHYITEKFIYWVVKKIDITKNCNLKNPKLPIDGNGLWIAS